uniref:C3H1-type domain-containing protein n=1 Tax=Alexandrium monilatum TaxID=311494 RepID=A0A7S4QY33_9DINO|mmetsp:Transcript_80503/g.239921  ORF Transcript_80503/g.239921 Transcript_80503/m.239921 type:complete len:406 (+) Transcript_80503:77-1294(+)
MAMRPDQAAPFIADDAQPSLLTGEPRHLQPSQDDSSETHSGVDDLLYGPGVFQKLPEWMTGAGDSEEEEEESGDDDFAPYGRKLDWLVAGVCDDGDTTTPPSEPQAELSSGSDDESGSGAKSPSVSPVKPPTAGTSCRLDLQEGARPASSSSAEVDGGLVDLDPEEGRRRGAILMALLAEKPDGSPASDAPSSPPAVPRTTRPEAASRPVQLQLSSWTQGTARGHIAQGGNTVSPAVVAAAAATAQAAAAACYGRAATHALYTSLVLEAACRAFGSGAVDVASSASGGFVVWLCGWAAVELQRSHQAVLETLSQALRPYLSQDIVAVEQRTAASAAGSSGARLSGVASAVASTRLTLWCLSEEAKYEQSFCWQYVRNGVCPRGALCRWHHAMPPTYPIDIEVAAA